jgi:hypothetical protein
MNQPRIKKPDKLWRGDKPNVNLAYTLGEERGVDAIVMYWRPSEGWGMGGYCTNRMPPYEIRAYLIDVQQRKLYQRKGPERKIESMTSQVLSEFLKNRPKIVAAAPTQRSVVKRSQTTTSASPVEGITLPAGGSVEAINAAAEAYCGSLSKKSKLIAAPPKSPNYVFQCYPPTKTAPPRTPPTTVAKVAPEIQPGAGSRSYKVGIFPASGGFAGGRGPGTPWEEKYAAQVFVNQMRGNASSLSLAYSHYDPGLNQPRIYDYTKMWAGEKPKLSAIYREAGARKLDAVFIYRSTGMYMGYDVPTDPMPIELYLIDVKQKQTYAKKGDTDRLEQMVQGLISRFLQGQPAAPRTDAPVVATAPAPVTHPSPPTRSATPPALAMRAPVATSPGRATLRAGTAVPVELMENVNSELNQVGDTVALRVSEDIYVDNRLVIQKGAPVQATVGRSEERGHVGKSGSLTLHPVQVKTADGRWASLHKYELKAEAKDASGRVAGAIIAFGVWGLLAQGNAATIVNGTHYQVVIAQNIVIDTAAVQPLPTLGQPAFRAKAEFKKVSRVKFSKGKRGKDIVLEIALNAELAKVPSPTSSISIVKMGNYVLPRPINPIDVERDEKHNVLEATFDWWNVIKYVSPGDTAGAETPVLIELRLPDGRVGTASAGLQTEWN